MKYRKNKRRRSMRAVRGSKPRYKSRKYYTVTRGGIRL